MQIKQNLKHQTFTMIQYSTSAQSNAFCCRIQFVFREKKPIKNSIRGKHQEKMFLLGYSYMNVVKDWVKGGQAGGK